MITKAMLDQLRAEKLRPQTKMDYTPTGMSKFQVISKIENERLQQIARGTYTLRSALETLQRDQALSSREGLARAHFNNPKQEIEI